MLEKSFTGIGFSILYVSSIIGLQFLRDTVLQMQYSDDKQYEADWSRDPPPLLYGGMDKMHIIRDYYGGSWVLIKHISPFINVCKMPNLANMERLFDAWIKH